MTTRTTSRRQMTADRDSISDLIGRARSSLDARKPTLPTLRNCRVFGELVDADVPVWKPGDDLELAAHRLDVTS